MKSGKIFIIENRLDISNVGSSSTFSNKKCEGVVIDLTLANFMAMDNIKNWRVTDEETFSDHRKLRFDFNLELEGKTEYFQNIRRTDWELFRELTKNRIEEVKSRKGIDKIDRLTTILRDAFSEATPYTTKDHNKNNGWFNKQLQKSKDKYVKAKRRFYRNKTEKNEIDKKEAYKEYRRELKNGKKTAWRRFCSELDGVDGGARMAKILKGSNLMKISTLKKDNGEFTANSHETCEELLKKHYNCKEVYKSKKGKGSEVFEKEIYDEREKELNLREPEWEKIKKFISLQNIEESFKSFKSYKSPGADDIYPIMLVKTFDIVGKEIQEIFTETLLCGTIPEEWNITKAILIPKPGRASYDSPKSYRPISLTSFLMKGLERIILWYLELETLKEDRLNKKLYAYRKGKSTETALHQLTYTLEKTLGDKEDAIVVFLDIEAAFNNAPVESLLHALYEMGTTRILVEWIRKVLENRRIRMEMAGVTIEGKTEIGVPQGGILSPILWNLIMNKLLNDRGGTVEYFCYADDIAIIARGKVISTLVSIIREEIKQLEIWARKNSMNFSASKTVAMMITNKRKTRNYDIKLGGENIKWVKEFKYLGVIIDDKLKFNKHIDAMCEKARGCLFQCQKVLGKTWGLKPKVMKWMYEMIIKPIMTYGSVVWSKRLQVNQSRKKIDRLHSMACRMIGNTLKSTPTSAIEILLGIKPIDLEIIKTAISTSIRIKRSNDWKAIEGMSINKSHTDYIKAEKARLNFCENYPSDIIKPIWREKNYKITINKRDEIFPGRVKPIEMNLINVYTDGSKDENDNTGYAYLAWGQDVKKQKYGTLGNQASVFETEVFAIQEAAEALIMKGVENKIIKFYVDSQSALKAINKIFTDSQLIDKTKETLNELGTKNDITLSWIPGHSNYRGNEIADRLAKRGNKEKTYGPEPHLPIGKKAEKTMLEGKIQSEQIKRWRESPSCRQTKLFFQGIRRNETKYLLGMSRVEIARTIGIITGHDMLNKHSFRTGFAMSPNCRYCEEEEETSVHIIGECPVFMNRRREMLGNFFLKEEDIIDLKLNRIVKYMKEVGEDE